MSEAEYAEIEETTGGSVVDMLRRRRQALASETTTDLDIPGYGGELFARYHLIDGKQLNAIATKVQKTEREASARALFASIDVLIAACDGLYIRDHGVEKGVHEVMGEDTPVRYDQRLAEFLQYEGALGANPTARGVVLGLFGNNELAILTHSGNLQRWMMGLEAQNDEEFLGEL